MTAMEEGVNSRGNTKILLENRSEGSDHRSTGIHSFNENEPSFEAGKKIERRTASTYEN